MDGGSGRSKTGINVIDTVIGDGSILVVVNCDVHSIGVAFGADQVPVLGIVLIEGLPNVLG